jgi:Na+/melibiose symporter-like transporter
MIIFFVPLSALLVLYLIVLAHQHPAKTAYIMVAGFLITAVICAVLYSNGISAQRKAYLAEKQLDERAELTIRKKMETATHIRRYQTEQGDHIVCGLDVTNDGKISSYHWVANTRWHPGDCNAGP